MSKQEQQESKQRIGEPSPPTRTPGMRMSPSSYLAAVNSGHAAPTSSTIGGGAGKKEEASWKRAFFVLFLAIHLAWLHVHNRIFGQLVANFVFGQWSQSNRKIVIIGDDVALGVGDWVMLCHQPGLQGRINSVVNRDVLSRIVGRGVVWTALTAAKAGSTTEDWLPVNLMTNEQKIRFASRNGAVPKPQDTTAQSRDLPAEGRANKKNGKKPFWEQVGFSSSSSSRKPSKRGSDDDNDDEIEEDDSRIISALAAAGITPNDAMALRGASLFDKNFNPNVGLHRDADIVIIVLGSKDKCTILETVQNMSKICAELIKLGKHVIVTTIPMSPTAFTRGREILNRFRDRNEAMQHMVSGLQGLDQKQSSLLSSGNSAVVTFAGDDVDGHRDVEASAESANRNEEQKAQPKSILKKRAVGTSALEKSNNNPNRYTDTPPPPRTFTAAAPSLNSQRVVLSRVAESLTQDHCYRFNGKTFNGQGYTKAADVIMQQLKPMMRSIDGRREIKQMI